MDYERVLRKIGDFGPYQLLIFFILAFTALQTAMDLEFIVFMNYTPDFNCSDPAFVNATTAANLPNNTQQLNQCETIVHDVQNVSKTIVCSQWVYDQSQMKETFVTEFNLVCGRQYFKTYAEMLYFTGVSVGMVFGSIGDHIGRRKIILICAVWEAITMTLTPLMPTVESVLFLRFIRGFAISMYYQGISLILELVPMERRGVYGNNFWHFWSIGFMVISGIGYVSPNWRHMKLYSCIPFVIYLFFFFIIPESPRWLALRGRSDEAIKVLKLVARRNRKPFPKGFFDNFVPPVEPTGRFLELFKTSPMRIKTLLFWYTQTSISMCYFGLSLTSNFASENIFLNVTLLGLIEIPCAFLGWFVSDKVGRRLSSAAFMILTGIWIVCVPFVPKGWVRIIIAVLGKLCLTTGYNIVDIFLTEIFPTSIRNMGFFSTTTCASFGTILAPKINELATVIYFLPNVIFTFISVACGILIWVCLPETNNCPMPQTVDEADRFVRGREQEWTQEMASKLNTESVKLTDNNEHDHA